MRIFVSGIHSDPDPSPGLGIARCIRAWFPDAELVGVDYSARSSGIHGDVFDAIWLQRPWNELDLSLHAAFIEARLNESETYWFSGLDVEIDWLSGASCAGHPRLLTPCRTCLDDTQKPKLLVSGDLGMVVPDSIAAGDSLDLILWDPTDCQYIYPAVDGHLGYGDLAALRVPAAMSSLRFGNYEIAAGKWTMLYCP